MHPSVHAQANPDKPAFIMAYSGETVTYGELEARSNQGAHLFRSLGLETGDSVAFFIDNHPRYYELLWAAQRSGLRFTCLSSKLSASEVEYIVKDCEAKVLVASPATLEIAQAVAPAIPNVAKFMVGGEAGEFLSFEMARAGFPETPIADQSAGRAMLYSSGTTGRPKGVKRAGAVDPAIDAPNPLANLGQALYGWTPDTVYLSPAPLYHAAPLGWSMAVQALGGTVVLMERFDPEDALRLIEKHKVTTAQWVPTHFVRMLKLPPEVRTRYDMSSLKSVFHAAAPCPVPA
jgi:long-chain acyl-CoA synthetase